MRKFDFYEFTSILVPGATLLIGVAFCSPSIKSAVLEQDLTVGEAALSLIVAYGLGHLVQALGNLIEWVWWRAWGGMPSDWPRSGKHALLSEQQTISLDPALTDKLQFKTDGGFKSLTPHSWYSVVRQVNAFVAGEGKAQRVEVFLGNYGLNRGLAAALIAVCIVVLVTQGWPLWTVAVLLLVGAGIAMYRMHRFGVHYARELFVQFLQLPGPEPSAAKSKE